MKKFLTLVIIVLAALSANAQTQTISGNITQNTTLTNDKIYLLDGYVYVKNGATLTIQPGTIIKGKKGTKATLIITRGSKIDAQGTQSKPIVFTSHQPAGSRNIGDWGGIVILGKATINRTDCTTCPGASVASGEAGSQQAIEGDLDNTSGDGLYGGTDDNDNSGFLTYVRIEFAGVVISPGNEINGLTMGAVGRGTTLHHVQSSFINDDGFEWFGGTVNAKYLISYRNVDDDFDTDFGYRGKVQFGVALRDSSLSDLGSGPTTNSFESDNDGSASTNKPYTEPVFSNMTIVGPMANGKTISQTNSFQNAARIRKNSGLSLFNSVLMAYPTGIFVDGDGSANKFLTDTLILKNNVVSGWTSKALNAPASSFTLVETKFYAGANDTVKSMNNLLKDPFNYTNPDWTVAAGSKAASGASFTGNKINDAFFTATTYRGAFGTDNWTSGWANFDPQNADYSKPLVGINNINLVNGVTLYPNPAQNNATLKFNLTSAEKVTVKIYNISGVEVMNVVSENMGAGNHNIGINTNDLHNGLYFAEISTTGAKTIVKLSVIK